MIEQVFEPFVTTKTRGTDLGLSIARRLTTLQGGLVTVSDREGGGTVASLKLPLADLEASSGTAEPSKATRTFPDPPRGRTSRSDSESDRD
jgi:two-component system, NtrC family, sensor histidine kinase HydH